VYDKLEDDIKANRSLKASFFQRGGGGNVTALAATLVYDHLTGPV